MDDECQQSSPPGESGTPQPHPPEEAGAFDSFGAQAPLDESAGRADSGADAGQGGGVASFDAGDGQTLSGPPTPPDSATALDSGDGGAPARKKEKTIDWGKFNHIVENFTLIYGTDTVWDASERMIMKISNMAHAHGTDMVRLWKGSERRRTVRQTDVVFDPTMACDPETSVNLYDGLAMAPKQGDVQPIMELIRHLVSRAADNEDDVDQIMNWLICWLAYPLQHPGAKLRTACVFHGDEGAGKNFLFDIVCAIYGKYGALVGQDELEDKFNDWRSCKLFVVGDEVSSRAELVHNKNRLKALITSPTVQINPKNLPRREEKNHMNIVFLSNELQPLALDNSDRRYLVIYTPPAREFDFYRRLGLWRDNGGIEAFFHFLLHANLDGFDPYAPAPMTEAKRNLIGLNRKSPELFWSEWADGELDLPYRSCSLGQAYQAYLKWCLRTGERYPFKREQFTPTVLRFSEAMGRPARSKVMKLLSVGAKKVERMFLVTEPSPEIPQGEWAAECVREFEDLLKVYLGFGFGSRSHGNDDNGEGGAN